MLRDGILAANVDRCCRITPQQRVQSCASDVGILLEMNQVLRQAGECNLSLEDVLLRHVAHGVLDPRCLDRLPRDGDVLVMDTQFVLSAQ